MSNDIEQDRVFIQIEEVGQWLTCSDLSANSWNVYETFAEMNDSEVDESRDFLVLDTDDYSGLMSHYASPESFDFGKYSELYEWLEFNNNVECEAVNAMLKNTPSCVNSGIQEAFQNSYIGEFSSSQAFLQDHCSEVFEGINPNWLDWENIWEGEYRHSYFEIDNHYFHNN